MAGNLGVFLLPGDPYLSRVSGLMGPKSHSVMAYDPPNTQLNLVCQYLIEGCVIIFLRATKMYLCSCNVLFWCHDNTGFRMN